jgi:hypothetical protein
MSAAIPLNIVKTFSLSGICVIVDDEGVLRCQVRPDKARWLLTALAISIPEWDEIGEATSDDHEIHAFGKEMADLLYDTEKE